MSKMFMDALEKHIDQLKKRTSSVDPKTAAEQKAHIEFLIKTSNDGRFQRSLTNALKRLDSEGPKETESEILPHLTALHEVLSRHPEYRKRRKRGPSKPKIGVS